MKNKRTRFVISPVLLFTFNRLSHLKKTINSLKKNKISKETELIIFSDGPKDKEDIKKIKEVRKYISQIEDYIYKKKPVVVSLNINKFLDPKFIDYYIACDQTRILLESYDYSNFDNFLIVPLSRVESDIKKQFNKKKICDFGLKIGNNNFQTINKNGCILKKPLAIAYALSFANASKARKILLAGMDGYSKKDINNVIMQELFYDYKSQNLCKMYAVTPTSYNINKNYII